VNILKAVTETERPRQYWSDLKTQLSETEDFSELYDKIVQLKMPSPDGKKYATDAVNVETLFRVVQSIPSKQAEPFKRWLAKVGYERIQEIQNPEIGVKRAMLQWQIQGRSDDWIDARIRSIVTRKELTGEWKNRGIVEQEYGLLTNVISRKTFGVDTAAHKKIKGLNSQPLRDHMTDLELIFTMLGEKSTTAIATSTNAQGFNENKEAAASGGKIAGSARRTLEEKLGKPIVSKDNFLSSGKRENDPQQLTTKFPKK
jgi:DNA-damage-inducible protein D